MKLFRTATLGCKVNQYETQFIRTALLANGYSEANDAENDLVELVVVNTCSVTGESDAKSRKTISYWGKKCPQARIVVLGCFASSDPKRAAAFPGVVRVVEDKRKIVDFLTEFGLTTIPDGIQEFSERRRAYVKVQDGCRVGCSYCIIPKVRPYLLSRPVDEVVRETETLLQNGYREIVLTGIHLGHYGLDFLSPGRSTQRPSSRTTTEEETFEDSNRSEYFKILKNREERENRDFSEVRTNFANQTNFGRSETDRTDAPSLTDYLEERKRIPPERRIDLAALTNAVVEDFVDQARYSFRIRWGSLEAVEVSDRLLDVLARFPDHICPHLHLSMQSGDDSVLKNMRRRWSSSPFVEKCRQIRERFPAISLTTDVIVGFPGETDEQFLRTCDVVERIGFSKVHIFRFSPRKGTVAAERTDQISEAVKKERAFRLSQVADRTRLNYMRSLVGRRTRLLIEDVRIETDLRRKIVSGTTGEYLTAILEGDVCGASVGDLTTVEIVGLNDSASENPVLVAKIAE